MSTIREIARELNLSHTTVSRVLNARNEQTISPSTRERVWAAARQMGYSPHAAARALATGRSQIVALLMRSLYTAFHAEVVHEMEQTLRRSGYQVLVSTVDWAAPEDGLDHFLPIPSPVDGYLAFETAAHVSTLLAAQSSGGTRKATVPLIAMGGHHIVEDADSVGFDLAAGTDMAMEHLLGLGRRRIALVSEQRKDLRIDRYREAMRQAGLPEQRIVIPSQQRGDVRETVRAYFGARTAEAERPDALFCFNDEVAIGAYRALRDLKIGIGDEVALVGFDGIEDGVYLDTPITTVALPVREMCRLSWEAFQSRLEDPSAPPRRTMLRPSLIVRESTVAPPPL